jgi:fused signal recognition particle receptor
MRGAGGGVNRGAAQYFWETGVAENEAKSGMLKRLFGDGQTASADPAPDAAPRGALFSLNDQALPAIVPAPQDEERRGWWQRLRHGLTRSSSAIGQGISDLFTKRKLTAATLEELEDLLLQADLGVATAGRIAQTVGKGRFDKGIDPEEVKAILAAEVERVLAPVAKPLVCDFDKKPYVILVIGVNGSGKTTTIGKIAAKFRSQDRRVMLAAGDTFRAAAIEQLKIWSSRSGAAFVAREQGSDAASLAFEALREARDTDQEILIMDTAGRLQNRKELMAELEKITRVMKKLDASAPHAVLLVLDATVGQNALSQVEIFGKTAGVTGLVMTKLDGTARGGILVAIADRFKLPIHFIGVGETADDLEHFAARDFARAIAGLER